MEHKKRHAKDTKPGSVWDKHPLPMMAKTVVKAALRFAPLSPDVRGVMAEGDDIPEGSMEMVTDPSAALALASGAFDALDAMDDAEVVAP
ncbi:recombinase RecT, partial [Lacticaseibacillus paracasei]